MVKQLVTQCSNIWKMGLLSWVEIDEAQHTCYTEGEPWRQVGGRYHHPARDWVLSPKSSSSVASPASEVLFSYCSPATESTPWLFLWRTAGLFSCPSLHCLHIYSIPNISYIVTLRLFLLWRSFSSCLSGCCCLNPFKDCKWDSVTLQEMMLDP